MTIQPEILLSEKLVVTCDKEMRKLNPNIKIWQKNELVLSGDEFTIELSNIILKIKDGLIHVENKN